MKCHVDEMTKHQICYFLLSPIFSEVLRSIVNVCTLSQKKLLKRFLNKEVEFILSNFYTAII